jgi:hypothetical protein
MSRSNPLGFAVTMAVEVAVVAGLVTLLPKVDLKPDSAIARPGSPYAASAEESVAVVSTGYEPAASIATHETSYYRQRAAEAASDVVTNQTSAPPLINDDTSQRRYVEQRLDRSSQQLLNSVGGYVSNVVAPLARPSERTTGRTAWRQY